MQDSGVCTFLCLWLFFLCVSKLLSADAKKVSRKNKPLPSVFFEKRIEITSLAVMKQRCQNDFRCTFQTWLGSCRCSLYAGASQKPGGQAECSASDVRFSCTPALIEKIIRPWFWRVNLIFFCTLESSEKMFSASSYDFDFVIFNFGVPLLPTWAVWLVSGNSFRHSFIERGHAVWLRERVCFGCVCVFVCV